VLRAIDFTVASALLVLLLPILLVAALFIRLDSPGPSFYRSRRVGYRGRELRMLKFRKMVVGAEGVPLTSENDSRFTRAGGVLAKFKLDEIPQLWHVVLGEMSLVGPRPEDPVFVEQHLDAFEPILKVRPGITGLSQIAFVEESRILSSDDPLEHYIGRLLPQKIGLDQLYATRRSLTLNFRILFWTLAAVMLRRNVAVHRESGKMRLRRR
jgi:lipopolysaccharide/colanic/teichoic acid biosynthesis glycosyltransferase